jgi:putative membrane protein
MRSAWKPTFSADGVGRNSISLGYMELSHQPRVITEAETKFLDAGMLTTMAGAATSERAYGTIVGACAVAAAGVIVLGVLSLGPLSEHMATHIAVMNIAAPTAAVALYSRRETLRLPSTPATLWIATFGQLAVLWFAHSPIVHLAMQSHFAAAIAVHSALFLSALAFWNAIVRSVRSRWHAIFALLTSGKLACLLGALLTFSPRLIYGVHHHAAGASDAAALADQHLAGLLMIVACPLSFVLTAIVLTAQALGDVSTSPTGPLLDRSSVGQ